jgi:hypothetical protein
VGLGLIEDFVTDLENLDLSEFSETRIDQCEF